MMIRARADRKRSVSPQNLRQRKQRKQVIVGRAADHVLREYEGIVRIFIYAPEEYKIKRVMEIYGDSAEDAKKNVRRSDDARASYYKNISKNTWGDRRNYDLMIDSSIGVDASVYTICTYLQNRY